MRSSNESRGVKRKSPTSNDQQPTLQDFFGRRKRAPKPDDSFESDLSKSINLSLQAVTQEDARTNVIQQCCPICQHDFDMGENEFQEHVNNCLDENEPKESMQQEQQQQQQEKQLPVAATEEQDVTTTTDKKQHQTSTWTNLFRKVPWKVTGIWSSKDDEAPCLMESGSSTDWFGQESKPGRERTCPLYKKLPGTSFTVDAFCYGNIPDCDGYFLSHFHSDHYGGLSKRWEHGPIYCSRITANCLQQKLEINPDYIKPLPMDQECKIPGSNVTVHLIDANHCPGSVLFLFKVPMADGSVKRYLHTGDFRANPRMCVHPALKQPENPPIDILFLDTTYLNPKYAFPAQDVAIDAACRLVRIQAGLQAPDESRQEAVVQHHIRLDRWFDRIDKISKQDDDDNDKNRVIKVEQEVSGEHVEEIVQTTNATRTTKEEDEEQEKEEGEKSEDARKKSKNFVVVVGSYALGKERIFCRLAQVLQSKIFVTEAKRRLLECIESKELNDLLTDDPRDAQVHVIPIRHLQPEYLIPYMKSLKPHYESMLAFRPTGWTFKSSAAQTSDMSCSTLARITAPVTWPELQLKPIFSSNDIKLYGVPYSEHSSFRELAAFIASLQVRRIVPTVNVSNENSRKRMGALFQKWQEEKQKNGKVEVVPFSTLDHW